MLRETHLSNVPSENLLFRIVTDLVLSILFWHLTVHAFQEGANGDSDVRTIERVVESIRYSWQRVSTNRESALSKQESRCRFEQDLSEVHKALDTLASQLAGSRGRYGENIVEAKATSADFATFERTIVVSKRISF